jgi:UDP-N-acetylmuramoyl-L-alanyl-D-glutamate--2,6-diaminopimelate ligase
VAAGILDALARAGVAVTGLTADSRRVAPGEVFLACPGARSDGRAFIPAAVEAGAGAVLWERAGHAWDPRLALPNFAVDDLQRLSGELAHLVYGRPSEALWMAGVTGTNGKTSVSQWIAAALTHLGRRCGVVGTLGNGFPGALTESLNTTPDAIALQQALARLRAAGAAAVALEVSSIGLDQGRTNGCAFDVAVFTNLTRDHLEYHGSMEAYAAAKARLFELPGLETAVLNLDDAFGRELAGRLAGGPVRRIGYSIAGRDGHLADELLAAQDIATTAEGLRFTAVAPQGRVEVRARLVGRFNVSNLLAVLAALLSAGVPLEAAAAQLARLAPPAGRMQMLGGGAAPLVIVDYAHTPDALEQALAALRETARCRGGRLAVVFGCGGERDPGKRPLMGAAAARGADEILVTSDNPRREDPEAIIAAVLEGAGAKAAAIADRALAIETAVTGAQAADVVLIAGKGHETYQELGGVRRPFSDVEQAQRALARREARP